MTLNHNRRLHFLSAPPEFRALHCKGVRSRVDKCAGTAPMKGRSFSLIFLCVRPQVKYQRPLVRPAPPSVHLPRAILYPHASVYLLYAPTTFSGCDTDISITAVSIRHRSPQLLRVSTRCELDHFGCFIRHICLEITDDVQSASPNLGS